jgi:hypothetical protein
VPRASVLIESEPKRRIHPLRSKTLLARRRLGAAVPWVGAEAPAIRTLGPASVTVTPNEFPAADSAAADRGFSRLDVLQGFSI